MYIYIYLYIYIYVYIYACADLHNFFITYMYIYKHSMPAFLYLACMVVVRACAPACVRITTLGKDPLSAVALSMWGRACAELIPGIHLSV